MVLIITTLHLTIMLKQRLNPRTLRNYIVNFILIQQHILLLSADLILRITMLTIPMTTVLVPAVTNLRRWLSRNPEVFPAMLVVVLIMLMIRHAPRISNLLFRLVLRLNRIIMQLPNKLVNLVLLLVHLLLTCSHNLLVL